MRARSTYKRGFSLLEVLVAVAIMAIVAGIALNYFGNLDDRQSLDTSAMLVTSVLNEARSQTLSSKSASNYGVHIESSRLVLFKGGTYSSSDPENVNTDINPKVGIKNISLTGGGSDVVFDRLTGATSEPGSLTLYLLSDASSTKNITISGTGTAE